jgi:L-arabinose isomerase
MPVLTDSAAIRRVMLEANSTPECIGVIAWMHTFSPAKMWIAVSTRCASRCCTCTRSSTRRCPWQSIDMDFMNLNQAAHGDREFGYIQTRIGVARKTVAGHVPTRRYAGASTDGCARHAGTPTCVRCDWRASATTCATSR